MSKRGAVFLKSLLRTCATSATTVLVMFWGWIAVIYFSGLELILGIFGLYALVLAPVVVICADPPTRWRESLGVAWMIRSTGVFLGFCLASTMLIPPFDLNNIQEFMIYIMGLTAFYIVLCAALIGPRRIFREILESGKVIQRAHGGALLFGPLACGWNCPLECEVRVSAPGAQRRRAPRSARSPGNRRARHLTREHVCQRYVLAG